MDSTEPIKKIGFAALSPERMKEIASMGGKAAHKKGTGRQITQEEARIIGKKGGDKTGQDREHMTKIGAKGRAAVEKRKKKEKLITVNQDISIPIIMEE